MENDEETTGSQSKGRRTDHLKPWQFKPGQSGNPSGMKPGTISMKEWAKNYLASLTEDQRLDFMKGLNKDIIWRMAEGQPAQDITSGGEKINPIPIYGGQSSNPVQGHDSDKKDIPTA